MRPLRLPISREANLSAERPSPETEAWISGAYADPGRPGDSEAPSREGSEAPLGLSARTTVKRRQRLSRSRDFDAVYRKGRSVSTRFLVLYSFPRGNADGVGAEDARLGIAVSRKIGGAVVRNRLKRRLRAAFDELSESVPGGRDYVLIARPGLTDAIETQEPGWLVERVDEVFRLPVGPGQETHA
jgi:ribonuclease P protein component